MHAFNYLLISVMTVIAGSVLFIAVRSASPFMSTFPGPVNKITPTPFPYEEITIPALRARTYKSTLGPLTKYEDNGQFTSYLTYYSSDSYRVNALLTKPNGEIPQGGWPAIVFVHGYIPPKQYETTQRYVAYVNSLADAGFVVFKIDLRGNGQSEGTPHGAYYSGDYVVDTLNAMVALQESGFVNPKRIGLWGHSMAGNVVMRSFAVRPTIPAVVIWAGVGYSYEDIAKYRIHDASYLRPDNPNSGIRNPIPTIYGPPNLNKPFWKELAPVSYLNDLKGAIEIHHAVDDDVVSISYSRDLMALLDKTKVRHALYEYPSGGHNISGSSFDSAMSRTIEFYKTNL